jgi:hypothetical protein
MMATVATSAQAVTGEKALEIFKNCPYHNPETVLCLYAKSQYSTEKWEKPEGISEFQAGNATVPLKRPLILQGGLAFQEEEEVKGQLFINPENGTQTLQTKADEIPGGLTAFIDASKLSGAALAAYNQAVAEHKTKVTATIEAAPTKPTVFFQLNNLLSEEGTALTLPVKLKLTNPFLGESCYAGSDENAIAPELTDGVTSPPPPNEPIKGKGGHLLGYAARKAIKITEDTLVNNSYAAPGVEGCGEKPEWSEEVDAAIDAKAGLPSPAGTNKIILHGKLYAVEARIMREVFGP